MAKLVIEIDTRDKMEINKIIRSLIALVTPPPDPDQQKKEEKK